MQRILPALIALTLLVSLTPAQPHGTDLMVSAGSSLVRITSAGVITTVVTAPGSLNMVAVANDNRDMLVAQTRSQPAIYRVDPATNTIVGTIAVGSPPFQSEIDYFNPLHTGEFVVASNNGLFAFDEAGTVRTIAAGSPFVNLQGVIQDVTDGNIVVGDIDASIRGLFSVALDGTVVTLYVPGAMSVFSLTQDHRDGRLIVGAGAGGTVYRVNQVTNTFTTVTPGSGNANAIAFDRWSGTGEIVVGSTVTNRIDIHGTIITSHAGVTRTGACFEAERNLVSRRTAANRYALDVSIPGQAGRAFVLGISATGFRPGIQIDSRVIQLVPDPVLAGSVQGILAPYLTGNIGSLNISARASATLDLSSLGPLPGLRLWAAAITLDSAAPSGVGVVTRPIVLVLE